MDIYTYVCMHKYNGKTIPRNEDNPFNQAGHCMPEAKHTCYTYMYVRTYIAETSVHTHINCGALPEPSGLNIIFSIKSEKPGSPVSICEEGK